VAFSAVVTTGIYCRPECSARPNAANVRPFELAAAAEAAGFRACLRCRPYRTAVAPTGPELVCRAVRLITDGALDDGNEDDLASRLGLSARHLRRLFVDHLGVTPDQLARSRRVHFARRLLDDTDLTITEIAFASGFGSVRQLNRACVDVFREAPTALRARRRRADRLVADGGLVLRLPFRPPLDWDAMVAYLAARAIAGVEHVDGATYRRTVRIDGHPGVLELERGRPAGREAQHSDHLVLTAHLPRLEGLIHVVQRARDLANLDHPVDEANVAVGHLAAGRPGLRPVGGWDPFELGVRAIVGQQVSVAGANTLMGRLVARTGTPVPGLAPLGLCAVFPSPGELRVADLAELGLTSTRQDAILAFAAAVDDGELPLDRSLPLDRFVESVCALPGLGPWTAQYLALRMGDPDAFPAGDLGLRRGAGVATATELLGMAVAWRPFRATAAVQLWARDPGTVRARAAAPVARERGARTSVRRPTRTR
jgi:AraC family transcriptional regulator of adaptative response / DNA-3-methyladenine glycosylase II